MLNLKTSWTGYLQYFRKGNYAPYNGSYASISDKFTLYSAPISPVHSAYGPQYQIDGASPGFSAGVGDDAQLYLWNSHDQLVNGDYRIWYIDGTRWEVDSYVDGTVGYNYNTYHQIWVRADL